MRRVLPCTDGLADKKAVLEQLADRHDFIDITRVGIYGHSGGGFSKSDDGSDVWQIFCIVAADWIGFLC